MPTDIKIVPEATPNADGEWITVPVENVSGSWFDAEVDLAPHIPDGHVMVQYRSSSQTRVPVKRGPLRSPVDETHD